MDAGTLRHSDAIRWLLGGSGVLGGLLCFPGLVAGGRLLRWGLETRSQSIIYFKYNYFSMGAAWFLFSLTGIFLATYSIAGKRRIVLAALGAGLIGFMTAVALPNENPPYGMMSIATTRLLGHADQSLALWDDSHGGFPSTQTEVEEALGVRPLAEDRVFYFQARALPYAVRIVRNGTGPYDGSSPTQPGVFVYAVRSDFREYWLTMSTLDSPAGGPAVFYRVPGREGRLWVMSREHHDPGQPRPGFVE